MDDRATPFAVRIAGRHGEVDIGVGSPPGQQRIAGEHPRRVGAPDGRRDPADRHAAALQLDEAAQYVEQRRLQSGPGIL